MPRYSRTIPRREQEEDYERCKTLGHVWEDFNPIDLGPAMYGKRMSLRCVRCTTERHDTIEASGRVGTRSYRYADGYIIPREERLTRAEMRLKLYDRISARYETSKNGAKNGQ